MHWLWLHSVKPFSQLDKKSFPVLNVGKTHAAVQELSKYKPVWKFQFSVLWNSESSKKQHDCLWTCCTRRLQCQRWEATKTISWKQAAEKQIHFMQTCSQRPVWCLKPSEAACLHLYVWANWFLRVSSKQKKALQSASAPVVYFSYCCVKFFVVVVLHTSSEMRLIHKDIKQCTHFHLWNCNELFLVHHFTLFILKCCPTYWETPNTLT